MNDPKGFDKILVLLGMETTSDYPGLMTTKNEFVW